MKQRIAVLPHNIESLRNMISVMNYFTYEHYFNFNLDNTDEHSVEFLIWFVVGVDDKVPMSEITQ